MAVARPGSRPAPATTIDCLGAGTDRATVLRRFVSGLQPGDEDLLRRLLNDDD